MELKQSFLVTVARTSMTVYEARILMKIVEYGQSRIKGKFLQRNLRPLYSDCEDVEITVPIKYLLSDGSNHYEDVREAAIRMSKRVMRFWNTEKNVWSASPIIYKIRYAVRSGLLKFTVYGYFFDALYDFTKGFSRYDLENAMSFTSVFSVRIYMLMNGQHNAIGYKIDYLKKMFGVDDKYKQNRDFIIRCIEPAINEISEKTSLQLRFVKKKEGRKVTELVFVPTYKANVEQNLSDTAREIRRIAGTEINLALTSHAGFTYRELAAHKELLTKLSESPIGLQIVYDIVQRARKSRKQKGWIINALRSELGYTNM